MCKKKKVRGNSPNMVFVSLVSPYINYIQNIRIKLGLLDMPPSKAVLNSHLDSFFLQKLNTQIESSTLPTIQPVDKLSRATYVSGHETSSTIASFRLGTSGLGNRIPIAPHPRIKYCPLCPTIQPNNEQHLFSCTSLAGIRQQLHITHFMGICRFAGNEHRAFEYYLNGLNPYGGVISEADYIARGQSLQTLLDNFLSLWINTPPST